MRRSFVVALVGVLGAGGGCSRPNPGFEVAVLTSTTGSLDDSSSGTPTTALPPMTTTGETTSAVTVTTGDESTSTSSSTSSSSSSSGDGSSGESSTGEVPWPVDCLEEDWVTTRAGHAAADTFFVNLIAGDDNCLGNMGVGKCPDQSLGAVPTFKVFHVGADDPAGDFAGLFAVRFGLGKPVYDGLEVPPEAFLGVEVTLRLGRGEDVEAPLPPMSFDVYQMPPVDARRPMDMPWIEGDNAVMKVCGPGEASYNCKRCDESMQEQAVCLTPWPNEFPWQPGVGLVMTAEFAGAVEPEGDLKFLIPGLIDEWDWLFAEGLLLVPLNLDIVPKPVEVRAREYADEMARPFISVVHCPFKEG